MYRIVSAALSSLLLAACGQAPSATHLPYYNSADFTPMFINPAVAPDSVTHRVSDFSCTDQHNQTITQKDIEGKIHVANFFFTGCGSICPVMMKNLDKTYRQFSNDSSIVFLSYSVTPWRDSVSRLAQYAANLNIGNTWHLLTGNRASIYALARRSYFAEEALGYNKDSTEFLHTEHILLVDKQKRIRGIYNGTLALETEQLAKDILALQQE